MPDTPKKDKIRHLFSDLTGYPIDHDFLVLIPGLATLLAGFSAVEGFFLHDTLFFIACCIIFLIFMGSYFLMKAGKYLRGAAWLMAFSTLILINIVWFRFEGSKGTAPVMLVMLLFCVSLFFRKIEKAVIISVILINLFLLFYIEYAYPFLINPLQDQIIRMADLFLTYTICGVFIIFVTQVLLRSYALEKAKAEQVDKLKSSFLANISHEIRTPLNAILGFATLIAEDDTSLNDRKLYARFMLDASKSLTNLIEEIIDIARIESDQVNIQKERCNIRDILELVYAHFDNATERQIKSSVSFNTVPASFENDVFIETDALILKQVLINLLDNAIKFTHNGSIEFGYEVQKSQILFHVKDSGIGIPKEECQYIFDNFTKVQHSKEKLYSGVGLGLALSKKMLELLDGEIWVDSEIGKGSTFWFTIPSSTIDIVPRQNNQPGKRSSIHGCSKT